MTVRDLIAVLEGWDRDLPVTHKDGRVVRGARIVETKDGPKVKLG